MHINSIMLNFFIAFLKFYSQYECVNIDIVTDSLVIFSTTSAAWQCLQVHEHAACLQIW